MVRIYSMRSHPNLKSRATIIDDVISTLASFGGRLDASTLVELALNIQNISRDLAVILANDLSATDCRVRVEGEEVLLLNRHLEALPLRESSFVVLDLETTGAKAPPGRITEIGAFRISGNKIIEEFHTLINPEIPIPPFITALTGISDQMVRNAPVFGDIADDLLDFIGDSVLVAHNASFDLGFLDNEIQRWYGPFALANHSLCTVRLSRKLVSETANHKLRTLADYFGVDLVNHHRAAADALATAKIFLRLLERMEQQGINTLSAAIEFERRKYIRPKRAAA